VRVRAGEREGEAEVDQDGHQSRHRGDGSLIHAGPGPDGRPASVEEIVAGKRRVAGLVLPARSSLGGRFATRSR